MNFYLEIQCEKRKQDTYIGTLVMLRDSPLVGGINHCKNTVMEAYKKFKAKNRNPKRDTKIISLKIVTDNNRHETVFEVKM